MQPVAKLGTLPVQVPGMSTIEYLVGGGRPPVAIPGSGAVEQVAGWLSARPAAASRPSLANVQAIKQKLIERVSNSQLSHSVGTGLAAGAGLAGIGLLAKTLVKSMQRNPNTYTEPIESVVYRPDRPKRRRKRAGIDEAISSAIPNSPLVGSSPALRELAGQDMTDWVRRLAPAAIALPVGLLGAKKLTDVVRGIARNNELRAAQREFELAMQQYAEAADQPRKITRIRKAAGMSEREQLIDRLAENCVWLSKTADGGLYGSLSKGMLAYMALSPLLAGVYGFSNRWDQRKLKDLDVAERQLNIQREQTNPTFMVANLQDPPNRDDELDDEEEDAELQSALEGGYNTDYM